MQITLFFFLRFIYSFYNFLFLLCWIFVAVRGLSLVVVSGGYSSLQCAGLSLQWLLLLWSTGAWALVVVAHRLSSCGLWALECRLSSCGARAQLLRSMWDLPGPGLEPVSPALAGGFLTTVPPGKSRFLLTMGKIKRPRIAREEPIVQGREFCLFCMFVFVLSF